MSGDIPGRLSDILPPVLAVSVKAGAAILDVYESDFAVDRKNDKSPLTLADIRSHEIISGGLSSLQEVRLPVLSEEGKDIPYEKRKDWEDFWLVDPLDGTKEFIGRNGEFTVNIALIHGVRPVLGVIYVPVKDRLYFGAEGIGSYLLEQAGSRVFGSLSLILSASLHLPIAPLLKNRAPHVTIVASRSHVSKETEEYVGTMKETYGKVDFLSAGSSIKFCLVAEGSADAYPRFGPTMEWDTAAGQAIVEGAGGTVLEYGKETPLRYNKEQLLNPWFLTTLVNPNLNAQR
jgi:3'(2'), 5'-bisphosphate nucleotidase